VFVCALKIELHLPLCHSLKEKRAVVRPVIDGLHNRFRVSVSEVDHHDLWQRCAIGVAVVGATASHVEDVIDHCERFVWSFPGLDVIGADRAWLE
jgi:uncharacterized protein YlxP (DUF503 family)